MLLLISSLQMLNAKPAESRSTDLVEGSDKVDAGDSIAIVPLTIPLLTGPATISTMVIYAEKTRHWWQLAVLVGYGVVIGLSVWAAFGLSGRIAKVLGKTGINVMTRLMGLLLAALAVEIMSDGLVKLFPGLGGAVMSDAGYDYIVCGAGTAGCLLANRLSADPSKRVLLVEAGGNDDYVWVHIPVGYLYCIGNPRTDWLYATEPAPGLNGRSLRYPRGKVLGGCSSINGMIYIRGQARDYDGWGRGDGHGGNAGWSWAECLPYFLRHEDFYKGADAFHAAPGFDRSGGAAGRRMARREAAPALGRARRLRGGRRAGRHSARRRFQSRRQRRRRLFRRQPACRHPLERDQGLPAPDPASDNLQLWTGAHIERIELDGEGRARGVRILPVNRGAPIEAHAEPGRRDRSCHRRDRHAADPPALGHRRAVAVAGARHRRAQGPSRRRRKPAGPPADPCCLRRRRCAHAQHPGQLAMGQGDDRPRIRAQAKRADEHGAVAARRLHEEPAGAGPRRSRIPRAAALARCLRRAAACVQRLHRQRLQPESDEPRPGRRSARQARSTRRASPRTICRPKPTR